MEELLLRIHIEAGALLVVERAESLVVHPGAPQSNVLTNDRHDVRAVADLGDLFLRDQPQVQALINVSEGRDPRSQAPPVKEKAPASLPSTHYYGRRPYRSQIGEVLFWNKIGDP